MYPYNGHSVEPPQNKKKGVAVSAAILGGVALVTSLVPFVSFVAWIFVIAATILAIIALVGKQRLRVLSIVVLCAMPVAFLIAVIVSITTISSFGGTSNPGAQESDVVSPEEVDPAAYASLAERDLALLVKDPESGAGDKVLIFARVTQFDAATGQCSFRANIAHEQMDNDFEYSDNALFQAGDGRSDCKQVDEIVNGDILKVWASGLGSESYDTQIGGSTTVPMFQVDLVELVPAAS